MAVAVGMTPEELDAWGEDLLGSWERAHREDPDAKKSPPEGDDSNASLPAAG